MEKVTDFIFGASKICFLLYGLTNLPCVSFVRADGDCSHEIKKRLLLGRKVITNLDSKLKSRDIILPTKFCLVKAMFFPVAMYGYESWKES